MKGLTERQREIYSWMLEFFIDHQRMPSEREIGDKFGIRHHNAVGEHLRRLESKGMIKLESAGPGARSRVKFVKVRFRAVRVRQLRT